MAQAQAYRENERVENAASEDLLDLNAISMEMQFERKLRDAVNEAMLGISDVSTFEDEGLGSAYDRGLVVYYEDGHTFRVSISRDQRGGAR